MLKVKNFFRNINLLNIMLITSIIILANYTVLPMFNMNIRYTLPAVKKTIGDTDEKPAESHIPSLTDYTMIAEENLFHPERKIPVEKKDEQPLPKPDFVLYGTLITDDMRIAYMEDLKAPRSSPGRGKRQISMKKGDTLSGFTLKEIEVEKIVMVRGEEKMVVNMNDPSHPKVRVSTAPVTQVVPGQVTAPSQATRAQQPTAAAPRQSVVPPKQKVAKEPMTPEKLEDAKKTFLNFFKKGKQ